MSVAALARQRVHRMKRGIPFPISGFYSLGSRASVQQAMSRLVKEGLLVRVERGFYSRPKPLKNLPSVNVVASANAVAAAWAKERGYKITLQGLEAAYRLGLQTQAPVKRIYWSNGPTREFRVGNELIRIQHKSASRLRWLNRPEGELMRGLLSLDQQHTPLETLKNAFHRLSIPPAKARQIAGKLMNEPALHAWRSQLITLQKAL